MDKVTLLSTLFCEFVGGWLSGSIILFAMVGDFWGNLVSVTMRIPAKCGCDTAGDTIMLGNQGKTAGEYSHCAESSFKGKCAESG